MNFTFPNLKVGIVIPAYNEELNIGRTIEQIPKDITDKLKIVVIDDGSDDLTSEIIKSYNVILLKHQKNRGNGAAISTGLSFCKKENFDVVVILDADGQHDPKYIKAFIKPIVKDGIDFVIGNRFKYHYDMEFNRKLFSKLMKIFFFIIFRKKIADPTNSYRAISKKILQNVEFESEYSLTQEMLYKIIPYYSYRQLSIKVKPRIQGNSFINLKIYLIKSVHIFIKFYFIHKIKQFIYKFFIKDN